LLDERARRIYELRLAMWLVDRGRHSLDEATKWLDELSRYDALIGPHLADLAAREHRLNGHVLALRIYAAETEWIAGREACAEGEIILSGTDMPEMWRTRAKGRWDALCSNIDLLWESFRATGLSRAELVQAGA